MIGKILCYLGFHDFGDEIIGEGDVRSYGFIRVRYKICKRCGYMITLSVSIS